ncbi:LysR substrate-binding domain-containing protein [Pseudomonas segetis]|uniref:Aminoethylphosphonate catabolism associated LysR family transcriptional regulator n=1 Tax=Pseudomonas segetis TaxID=298908 RepID=A0A239FJL9_9PSED|nr:LysR substrate-binding domain-containing protein [Pseudomonas segetis]SNS57140.1 aminoethylphosphonate catabolism associated LysR family transcriptional regulator [Pseudomonas segetis]
MLESELKAFYMVAQLGSVTLAAKRLGLSQPTVTNQIRQLESHFAVELFYRGGRRLTLSETGTRLLPLIKPMISHSLNVEFFLSNAGSNAGRLRIGATAPYYILDLLKAYRETHSGHISLELGNSQQMMDALDEYRVDLVTSSQQLTDSRLFCMRLGQDPLVLIVHRRHPLANQGRIPLSAIEGHCVLMREHGSHTRQLTEDMLTRAQIKLENVIEIGSREAIREAVLRNIGVSIIARHEVPDSQELRIVTIQQSTLLDEFIYCLKERRGARLIDNFLQVAQTHFG